MIDSSPLARVSRRSLVVESVRRAIHQMREELLGNPPQSTAPDCLLDRIVADACSYIKTAARGTTGKSSTPPGLSSTPRWDGPLLPEPAMAQISRNWPATRSFKWMWPRASDRGVTPGLRTCFVA